MSDLAAMAGEVGAHGILCLVVGPSGAGKDSVIQGVRRRVADRDDIVFPRRYITRAAEPEGEDHHSMAATDFQAKSDAGGFMLCWRAHDLRYGIGAECIDELAAGRRVVINVSRGVIDEARVHCEGQATRVRVLHVTAARDTLVARLTARGREAPDDIARRVERALAFKVDGPDVIRIGNDGELRGAVEAATTAILAP